MLVTSSPDPAFAQFRDQTRFWVQRVAVPLIAIIGLFGNLVTVIIMTRRRMRSTTNMYLAALAFADILYLVLTFLLGLSHYPNMMSEEYYIYWRLKPFLIMLTDASSNTSVWLTVTFTIERFIAVRYPMKGKVWCTEKRARMLIVSVFAFGVLFASPVPFEWQVIRKRVPTTAHKFLPLPATTTATTATATKPTISSAPEAAFKTNETNDSFNDDTYLLTLDYTDFGRNETYKTIYYWSTAAIFYFIPLLSLTLFNGFLIQSVHRSRVERKRMTIYSSSTSSSSRPALVASAKASLIAPPKPPTVAKLGEDAEGCDEAALESELRLVVNSCAQSDDRSGIEERAASLTNEQGPERTQMDGLRASPSRVASFQSDTWKPFINDSSPNSCLSQPSITDPLMFGKIAFTEIDRNDRVTQPDDEGKFQAQQMKPCKDSEANRQAAAARDGGPSLATISCPPTVAPSDNVSLCDLKNSHILFSPSLETPFRRSTLTAANNKFHTVPSGRGLKLANPILNQSSIPPQAASGSTQERRITIMLIAVVILFLVCQIPTAAMLLYTSVHEPAPNTNEHALVLAFGNIFNFLMAINAAGNFILYSLLSQKYRTTFVSLFCRFRKEVRRKEPVEPAAAAAIPESCNRAPRVVRSSAGPLSASQENVLAGRSTQAVSKSSDGNGGIAIRLDDTCGIVVKDTAGGGGGGGGSLSAHDGGAILV